MTEEAGQGSMEEAVEGQEFAGLQAVPDSALGEERLHAQARAFLRASKAPSTLRAYRSDWQHFVTWCDGRTVSSLPAAPETVALYLVALAEIHRPATLTRRLTSIAKAHISSRLVFCGSCLFRDEGRLFWEKVPGSYVRRAGRFEPGRPVLS